MNPAKADDPWSVRRSSFDPRVVNRYKAMLRAKPFAAAPLSKLVGLYRKHRSLKALVAEFAAESTRAPGNFALHSVMHRLCTRARDRSCAGKHLEAALKLKPDHAPTLAAMAGFRQRAGEVNEAAALYARAVKQTRSERQKKVYLEAAARAALAGRSFGDAANHYRALLTLKKGDSRVLLKLAQVLAEGGGDKAAVVELEQGLKRVGDSQSRAEILKEIAALQGKLGELQRAVTTYQKAMALTSRGHWLRREINERIIDLYRKNDDLKSLVVLYEKRWKRKGPYEHEVLGRLYDETGEDDKALAEYRAALRRAPHMIQTRLRVIALLERTGRADDVFAEYRKLARIAPGEPRFQLELARRLYRAGQVKAALSTLNRCAGRFPRDASVQSALADMYGRLGDAKRALAASRSMVSIEPDDPIHVINLGEQLWSMGQKKRAVTTWRRLLRTRHNRNAATIQLAEVLGQHGMVKDALALYNKVIARKPKDLKLRRDMALLLENNKRRAEALRVWFVVLRLAEKADQQQTVSEARSHLVRNLDETYRLRKSMGSWRLALAARPPDLGAGHLLARAYLRKNDPVNAAEVYRTILGHQPKSMEALEPLEQIYRQQRKLADAVALLKRMAELEPPRRREFYQQISTLLLQLQQDDLAEEYARRALALGTPNADSYRKLGDHYRAKGDHKGACGAYGKAIKLDPSQHQAYLSLAQVHLLRGERAQADKLYREVIRRTTNPDAVRLAFRRGVDLAGYLGTLDQLEKSIHARAATDRNNAEVYRGLLVSVYRRQIPGLIDRLRQGAAQTRAGARQALDRMAGRALGPLLDELSRHTADQGELVRMLGYLGRPGAVLPLLRIAEKSDEDVLTIYGGRRGLLLHGYPYLYRSRWSRGYRSRQGTRELNRVRAVLAVGRIGHPRGIAGLVRLLAHNSGAIRDAAAWALARVAPSVTGRDGVTVDRALLAALGDSHTTVQAMACVGLGLRRGAPALPLLAGDGRRKVLEEVMLDADRTRLVRSACAWALGALGSRAAVPRLADMLQTGGPETQRCAALSLGRIGDNRAVRPLVRALWARSSGVRRAVLAALDRLSGHKNVAAVTLSAPDVEVKGTAIDQQRLLERLSNHPDGPLDLGLAAPALLAAHRQAVVQGMISALSRHRDSVLRVLHDLDRRPDRPSLGPFSSGIATLPPDRAKTLQQAVDGVVRQVTPRLVALLDHNDPLVRLRAVSVLGKVAPPRLTALLTSRLADPDWRVQRQALISAGLAARKGVIPPGSLLTLVTRGLRSPRWQLREAGTIALETTVSSPFVALLAKIAADDTNAFVRQAAIRSLAAQKGTASIEAIRGALADKVPQVRAEACSALVRRGQNRPSTCQKKPNTR